MKKSDFLAEIRKISLPDLKEKARSIAEELMKLRFRALSGQLEQGHRFTELRRNLGRVKCIITEKNKAAA